MGANAFRHPPHASRTVESGLDDIPLGKGDVGNMLPSKQMSAVAAHGLVCLVGGLMLLFGGCGSEKTSFSPDEQIREGWAKYRLGEFDSAVRIFKSVQESEPEGSQHHLQALYGEASCWNHRRDRRDLERARVGYRTVIERVPEDPLAAWCALDIVRTRHLAPADQPIDYDNLTRDYADVYRRYPNTLAGEEAFLYESSLPLPRADAQQARAILERVEAFLLAHPKTPYLSHFYGIIAECYRKMDDQHRRIEYLIKALNSREVDPSSPIDDRSTAYWNIAYAAEFDAGNFSLARKYYKRLMNEYPQDVRIFGVRKALERMDLIEAALRAGASPPPTPVAGMPVSHSADLAKRKNSSSWQNNRQ
jgi:tetratricopeptide (TPR) repeat protein